MKSKLSSMSRSESARKPICMNMEDIKQCIFRFPLVGTCPPTMGIDHRNFSSKPFILSSPNIVKTLNCHILTIEFKRLKNRKCFFSIKEKGGSDYHKVRHLQNKIHDVCTSSSKVREQNTRA